MLYDVVYRMLTTYELCMDYFDEYPFVEQTDPVGPEEKNRSGRVMRLYQDNNEMFRRYSLSSSTHPPYCTARLVIYASEL